jgi:DNA repair/transcription protein MET18/MMS19
MMTVLDDPKRNVRKEAVDCRSAWSNMDEPEEDD